MASDEGELEDVINAHHPGLARHLEFACFREQWLGKTALKLISAQYCMAIQVAIPINPH